MNRSLPTKFGNSSESEYIKSIDLGIIKDKIILFDSHGDVVDISSPIQKWKIKRIINSLRKKFSRPL